MELYEDQQEIYDNVIQDIKEAVAGDAFLEHSFLSLSGAAGTGKTYLSHAIVDNLVNQNSFKVAVLAPTHKALKVIQDNIKVESKDLYYATVHSFLGLRQQIDFKTGEATFVKVKATDKEASTLSKVKVDLMIIDESSFVSTSLFEHIKSELLVHNRVKVVLFIGDKLQLAPIEDDTKQTIESLETKSIVFNETSGTPISRYNLTIPKRNGNVEVLDFYTDIRYMVERKAGKDELLAYLKEQMNENHDKIRFFTKKEDFIIEYIKEDRLGKDTDYIVTFTNKNVDYYNEKIRNYYLKRRLKETDPNYDGLNVPEIHDTDLFVVQTGTTDRKNRFVNSETISIKRFNPKTYQFAGKFFDGYECTTPDNRTFNVLSDSSIAEYNIALNILKENALKHRTRDSWQAFYILKGLFLDIKYQYSMTIHKSQGSSMDNVFVDCTNIDYLDSETLLRLFYVGTTRARNSVNILI